MLLGSINDDEFLAQGGSFVCFMIRHLVEISKDMVPLNIFKVFQLAYNLPVVVSQSHVVRGFVQM